MGPTGWVVDFFHEEKAPGHGQQGRSLDDTRFQTVPFCFILYIAQWNFRCSMSSGHLERWPRSSMPWAYRCDVQTSTADDLVHTFKTMEGLLLLVPPRTPRISGYDVYAHAVYVVICYMSITCICLLYVVICYMSVICIVQGSS